MNLKHDILVGNVQKKSFLLQMQMHQVLNVAFTVVFLSSL